ncbi:MAG: MFS transporter [Pseudomonadales bacterium]|jgi:MFS family permease|nr:MFS transporter [Pseudomonadales bacterium]
MNLENPQRFAAFSHRNYLYYWCARVCTTFSVQILAVSVAWQVYDLTRKPRDLGILGLVQFLPLLMLVLVTGAVADRFGRRRVMSLAVGMELVCAVGMLAYAMLGPRSPLPIFALLMLLAVARAFFGPASQSLVVNLVPREDFANAVTWNSSAWQIASIAGPAVGGLLYGISAVTAFGVACLMLVVALGLLLRIPEPPPPEQPRKVTFDSLFDGLRFIRRQRVVLGAISLDLFAVLLGGAVALLPVYARDILELGPWGLGLLRAAPGIGALAVAGFLAMSPIRDHAGYILLGGVALFGVFSALFGIATIPWLSILLLALVGAADMVSVVIRETLLQLWTPDEVRGRVNAVNMVFLGASNELGEFRAGLMASWIGVVPAVVFGGAGSIAVAGLWAWMFPQLRDARYLNKQE